MIKKYERPGRRVPQLEQCLGPESPPRKVAVIISAFRAERWIEKTLESVDEQRLPAGWELDLRIGVDGCQGTAMKLHNIGRHFWFSPENVGPYVMRNSLIQLGHADYYVIFDADDIMGRDYVQTLVRAAPDGWISGAARYSIDESGKGDPGKPQAYHSGVCCISHGAWEKLGGYRAWPMAADWDLIQRARALGVRVVKWPRPLYLRRVHPNSLTNAPETSYRSEARNNLVLEGRRLLAAGDLVVECVTTRLMQGMPSDMQCTAPAAATMVAVGAVEGARSGHGVYTRFVYDDDELFRRRLEVAKRTVVPCMAAQVGCAPFRWVWFAHERHRGAIESAVRGGGYVGELAFTARDNEEAIQTALDSDDWVSPLWLAEVQKAAPPAHEVPGGLGPSVIYWNPLRHDLASGKWLRPVRVPSWPSMFYAIYNPTDSVHVYATAHTLLDKLGAPVRPSRQSDMVALVVHDSNKHTKLKGSEMEVPPPFGAELIRREDG